MRPRPLTRWLAPLVRAYIRYLPIRAGKDAFWSRVVDPYFAWRPQPFVASTVFGMRIAGDAQEIIEQYIYYFGVWEPQITRWIARRLAPGDTFVDVGAHIGYYSLLASRLVGATGSVIAIEASPKTYAALRANLALNRVANVRALNLAVADRPGVVELFGGNAHNTGLTTLVPEPGFASVATVTASPLAAIIAPAEMRRVRLIKVDVEGAEALVVAGMDGLLAHSRPDLELVIETCPRRLARQGKTPDDVLGPFLAAGFHAYRLDNDYSALSYLQRGKAGAARRLHAAIEASTDVVVSRHDAETV